MLCGLLPWYEGYKAERCPGQHHHKTPILSKSLLSNGAEHELIVGNDIVHVTSWTALNIRKQEFLTSLVYRKYDLSMFTVQRTYTLRMLKCFGNTVGCFHCCCLFAACPELIIYFNYVCVQPASELYRNVKVVFPKPPNKN